MNFRNKWLVRVVRVLLGLFIIYSGVGGLMLGSSGSMEGVPPESVPMTQAMLDSGIFWAVKIVEVVAGLMLVVGFLPAFATLLLAPILLGAMIINLRLMPAFFGFSLVPSLLLVYLAYVYWSKYKALFTK